MQEMSIDGLLKTMAGIAIAASLGLASWCLVQVNSLSVGQADSKAKAVELEKRIDRNELRTDQTFNEVKRLLEKLNDKVDKLIEEKKVGN